MGYLGVLCGLQVFFQAACLCQNQMVRTVGNKMDLAVDNRRNMVLANKNSRVAFVAEVVFCRWFALEAHSSALMVCLS